MTVLRPVVVFFLDNGSAIRGLAFLDYGGPLAIPITVVVAALADTHANARRTDANTHTNFFRQGGRSDGECSDHQCEFHRYLLFLLEQSKALPNVPKIKPNVAD
jgi:hypothetical protein